MASRTLGSGWVKGERLGLNGGNASGLVHKENSVKDRKKYTRQVSIPHPR